MLSECCLQRQHSDKISVFDPFQRPKTLISSPKKGEKHFFCPNVVSMLSPETTFGQNKCFWPFSKAENIYFEPKKGEKQFFCPNVVSMLSPETTFRQHFQETVFCGKSWICLQLPPKVVWMLSPENIQTTLRQHNICKKKLLWTILDMFATRSQSCLNVVSRDNIQTTFREHSNNIGTKHFLKNLGHVCNSQPMLLDRPVQIDKLPCSHKLCCWSLRATKTNMHSDANTKHWPWRNITQQVVSKKEHLVTCANRRSCADIVWGLADCGLTLVYWGTAEWDNNIWSGVCKTKTNGAKWSWNYAIKEGYHWHIGC